MRVRKWLALLLMAASIAALMGYQFWDRVLTDNLAPEISVEEAILEISVYDDRSVLLQGISAQDDRDGDVTGSIIVESVGGVNDEGQALVHYAAFDLSGNVAKTSRMIRYTDYQSPRFRLNAPLLFTAGSTFEVVDLMSAADILDGDITHRVRATLLTENIMAEAGEYNVQFRVTNSLGDTQILELTAELVPSGAYNSELNLTDYLVYLPAGSRFDASDYLSVFRYAANRVELNGGVPEGYHLETEGTVDTDRPGVYQVSYALSCVQGYQTYTGHSRIVVIVED